MVSRAHLRPECYGNVASVSTSLKSTRDTALQLQERCTGSLRCLPRVYRPGNTCRESIDRAGWNACITGHLFQGAHDNATLMHMHGLSHFGYSDLCCATLAYG